MTTDCRNYGQSDWDHSEAARQLLEDSDEIVWACYCGNDVPSGVEPLTFWCRDCGEVGRVRRIFNSTGEPVEGEEGEN